MNLTDAMSCVNTNMMFYEDRLLTFEHWSKQIHPDKYKLSKAGFFYTGEFDKVICFACGAVLREWESTDDPWVEHHKWSKNCVFLKMTGYEINVDMPNKNIGGFHFPAQCNTNGSINVTNGGFKPPLFGSRPTSFSRPIDPSLFIKRI